MFIFTLKWSNEEKRKVEAKKARKKQTKHLIIQTFFLKIA